MSRVTVYLGGPITGLTFDAARSWRLWAAKYLARYDISSLDPLRDKEHLNNGSQLTARFDAGMDAVTRDLSDIKRSDILLLNFEDCESVSLGTAAEMGYAYGIRYYLDYPRIIAVVNTDVYRHIFVDHMADHIYPNLEHALDYIADSWGRADVPQAGSSNDGVELQDGSEGYRGWLTGRDQAPQSVADQPLRRAEVDGVRADKLLTSIPSWLDRSLSPRS